MSRPRHLLRSAAATTRVTRLLTQRDPGSASIIARLFREGADPWATDPKGQPLLSLCLSYGRRIVLEAWEEAVEDFNPASNPDIKDTPALLLVATQGKLETVDRHYYLRKMLLKGADPGEGEKGEALIRELLSSGWSPDAPLGQGWSIISQCLAKRPELGNMAVVDPQGQEHTLWDTFVMRAPMGVLTRYITSPEQKIDLDWRHNKPILSRIYRIVEPHWANEWQSAGASFKGSDENGDTLLHHYLRTPWTRMRSVEGATNLMELGELSWDMVNDAGESTGALALEVDWEPHPGLAQLQAEAQKAVDQLKERGNWKEVIMEAAEPEKARDVFRRRGF